MQFEEARKRFFDSAVSDILRAIDGRSLVGCYSLALCMVDYLVYFADPNPADKTVKHGDKYEGFLKKWFPTYPADWLYAFRCALVHVYGKADRMDKTNPPLKGYYLTHRNAANHLRAGGDTLRLNLEHFISDVVFVAWEFFNSAETDATLKVQIENRADDMLKVYAMSGASMLAHTYGSFHQTLNVFDNPNPTKDAFRTALLGRLQ